MDSFTKLLAWVKNELLALKTATIRSSTQMATIAKSININFTLEKTPTGTSTTSTQNAIITAIPIISQPMLAQITENLSDLDNRRFITARLTGENNAIVFYVSILGNDNDLAIINSGGTVSLSYSLDVTATADFNISVRYEDS